MALLTTSLPYSLIDEGKFTWHPQREGMISLGGLRGHYNTLRGSGKHRALSSLTKWTMYNILLSGGLTAPDRGGQLHPDVKVVAALTGLGL